MKHKGFTLIELLVVVLIIGILAAIALPQYQKGVERTRASDAISTLKVIAEANERHRLATGSYTGDIRHLDVEIPGTGSSTRTGKYFIFYSSVSNGTTQLAYALRLPSASADRTYGLFIYPSGQRIRCSYYNGRQDMCKMLSGLVGNY